MMLLGDDLPFLAFSPFEAAFYAFFDRSIFCVFCNFAFFAIFHFCSWHPPCINTYLSAENGENEKSARIRNATNTKRLKIWTQVSTQKQTQTRG
jgi:hypothetical protein